MTQPKSLLAHTSLLILTLFAASASAISSAGAQDFDSSGEERMLARINAMRAAQHLPALQRHDGLDAAARAHTADMATQGALSHISESSGTPADRVRAAGVAAATVAENVALHSSAAAAQDALLASEPHRANMLSEGATHIGLAVLPTENGTYVTQVFARIALPVPAASDPPAAPPAAVEAVEAPPVEAPPEPTLPAPTGAIPTGIPGVTIIAPPVAAPPVAAPPVAAPPVAAPPHGGTLEAQAGSQGTVVIHRDANRRVLAYWVFGSGRWWYYPLPPGAQPGQRLQPDLSVQGPPPGFGAPSARAPSARAIVGPRRPQVRALVPPGRGGGVTIAPFRGTVTITPGTTFYSVPPPPMTTERPSRGWRRQQRRWNRAYRRWQRQQIRRRRRAL